jgi:chemotaxis signal transduction protein
MNAFVEPRSSALPLSPSQVLSAGFSFLDDQNAAGLARPGLSSDAGIELRQGLHIGELNLMIGYKDASELAELPDVYRLPHAPTWFRGMTNLHGALIPVFSLTEYLGIAGRAAQNLGFASAHQQMMLVLGSGANAAAVLIDGLPRRLRFTDKDRASEVPVPDRLLAYVSASYWIDGQIWLDFQVNGLFDRFEADLRQEP